MYNKIFGFMKKIFFTAIAFIGLKRYNTMNAILLKGVSVSNQECRLTLVIININSNEHFFYLYSIIINKCSGSCNDINNLYAKLGVPDVVKNMIIKVYYIKSKVKNN